MSRSNTQVFSYAPLYIHRFRFLQPYFVSEADKFEPGLSLADFDETSDKLRFCRYRKGLLQREVATYLGIDRTTYCYMEETYRSYYPARWIRCLAKLYEVNAIDLLDEYGAFLYRGQAMQIKAFRTKYGLTQSELASTLGVALQSIKRWEQGISRMTKSYWMAFKNLQNCDSIIFH